MKPQFSAPFHHKVGLINCTDCHDPHGALGENHAVSALADCRRLWRAACEDWDEALRLGRDHGYRNAQATVLAPTGTIGLLMDCDQDRSGTRFCSRQNLKLAGGGYFKIVNRSVPDALRRLGYSELQISEIVAFVSGTNTLLGAPHVNRGSLKSKGLTDEELLKVEAAIPSVFDLSLAFAPWVLGKEVYDRLGVDVQKLSKPGFNLLYHLGFPRHQVNEADDIIVGRMTIEGAPNCWLNTIPCSTVPIAAARPASVSWRPCRIFE